MVVTSLAPPVTTVVPFSSLPSCAAGCVHLYDANGACVPPALPAVGAALYASCFCADPRVVAFSTGTAGVCDDACTAAGDSGGLQSIQNWFLSYCSVNQKDANGASATTTSAKSTSTSSSKHSSGSGNNTWISSHWQWVIFIVVVVVGIVAIWVGACLWHRRYLRKKDRQYALGNIRSSTGAASGTTGLNSASQPDVGIHDGGNGGRSPDTPAFGSGNTDGAFDTEKRRSNLFGRRRN